MKYKLINPLNPTLTAQEQIMVNRGFKTREEIHHYMNLTDNDINPPEALGEDLLRRAAVLVRRAIDEVKEICIVVDADCDGYTSSAILVNYLYDLAPAYVESHVNWYMHEGKQHGLQDCMDWIEDMSAELVICPDSASNDWNEIQKLHEEGRIVLILDHHLIEGESNPNCILINSQLPPYPNKELSGAGVVYQFCRYLDKYFNVEYADQYLDLCALGLIGDMMSLTSYETRRLITKGIEPDRIINPFIYEMWQKNKFKLGDAPTAWGETFYIVPFVNAITRSGTLEEKELIFDSMLKFKAFKQIPSNKRGHKLGEMERLVDQAVRTCTNVKNRQGRAETAGLELVEHLIEDNHMMEHKVLLFLLEPGQVEPTIRGLIANKLMAKYQRPCCMLTKCTRKVQEDVIVEGDIGEDGSMNFVHIQGEPWAGSGRCPKLIGHAWGPGIIEKEKITYEGSARGCDMVGVTHFKEICAATQVVDYTAGHSGAFGLGIPAENIDEFVSRTDSALVDMPNEPVYYVDFIWNPTDNFGQDIIDIARLEKYIGKDFTEPLVVVQNVEITKNNIQMMKSNTVKITLPNGVSMIRFSMPDEEFNQLYSENGSVMIDVIGKAQINEWLGNEYPQIKIEDYNVRKKVAYVF